MIRLTGRIRSVPIEVDFGMSRISENAILGMPFLEKHKCQMNFGEATLHLANQGLACNGCYGRWLRSHIQVVNQQQIPPGSKKLLTARITTRTHGPLGLVEGGNFSVSVASCISAPNDRGQITICCINPTGQTLQVGAGTVAGHYTTMEETDIQRGENMTGAVGLTTGTLPTHMSALFEENGSNVRG